jgi:alkanesulfonate monooxygenase SsuD/methylene tetrahydromethanopterin reductase-like flavin-dependent oxidoreductase (luciferase family)
MNDGGPTVKLGADCFSQHTDWQSYLEAMTRAEKLGYDSLWTPDHVLPTPPSADPEGPILEAYMCLAGVAASTSRATLGLLVSPISLRQPALLAKMVTTLDHISGGRAILGLGAGWAEEEHRQYGFEFGDGFGDRLDWLRQALPVMRGMLDGTRPSSTGARYNIQEAINSPAPVQTRLPILIGGTGPKVTLRLVAEYGNICNVIGSPEQIAETEARLVEHCEVVGRTRERSSGRSPSASPSSETPGRKPNRYSKRSSLTTTPNHGHGTWSGPPPTSSRVCSVR